MWARVRLLEYTYSTQKNLFNNNNDDNAYKHGLVYDMKTDMFVPIKDNKKWNK